MSVENWLQEVTKQKVIDFQTVRMTQIQTVSNHVYWSGMWVTVKSRDEFQDQAAAPDLFV